MPVCNVSDLYFSSTVLPAEVSQSLRQCLYDILAFAFLAQVQRQTLMPELTLLVVPTQYRPINAAARQYLGPVVLNVLRYLFKRSENESK